MPAPSVVPAPLSTVVANVWPIDPKIEIAGVTAYDAPPDTSFRMFLGAATSAVLAHARLNEPEIAIFGAG